MENMTALALAVVVSLSLSTIVAVMSANVWCPILVSTLKTALASSLLGGFAALLVVGNQISRARPVR